MKTCYKCGESLDDDVKFCLYCGAMIQESVEDDTDMPTQVLINPNYHNSSQQNIGNNGFDGNSFQNMGYDNSGYQGNGFQGNGYQNPYPNSNQPVKSARKPLSKKSKIIIGASCLAVLLGVLVYSIFFAGKLSKRQAEEMITDYMKAIERMDIVKVIELTIPEDLADDILGDYEDEFDGYDYDDLIDELEEELEDYEDDFEDIEIKFSNLEVGEVKQFDFYDYVDEMEKNIEDHMGERFSVEDMLEASGSGMTLEDVYEEIEEYAEDYDINLEDLYIVECTFTVKLDSDYTGKFKIDSEDYYVDHMFIYKYDDEWYMIPGIEGAMIPSLSRYQEKSTKANDISNAKSIKTAVEISMTSEVFYEELTIDHSNEMIVFTEEGLECLSDDLAEELENNIGKIPEVKYTENGAEKFAFSVSSGGSVTVYTMDESGYVWELAPYISYEYE